MPFRLLVEDDAALVELVASKLVRLRGDDALLHVYQEAEHSIARGDRLSAEAWFDIADAVERLLGW